jgi:type I restriction enzyme S subunit
MFTSQLENFYLPLSPLEEQIQVVSEIDLCFSKSDNADGIISKNLLMVESLRQSILKQAFEGKLVPQDPNDEPASLLLERIRAERIKESPKRGRKSKAHQARLTQ